MPKTESARMARPVRVILLVAILALSAGCRRKESDAALAGRWLTNTCTVSEQANLVRDVRARGQALETIFIEAFRNGPSQARLNTLLDSVEHNWSLLQVQIAEPDVYGLSQEEIAAMRSISLADEKREALERLDFNYRSAALTALSITRGPAGKELLAGVARNADSPFRSIASLVLKSY